MKIKTCEQLMELVCKRKSVVFKTGKPMPAAFVASMQLRYVYNLIQDGLYTYEPNSRRTHHNRTVVPAV